LPLQYLPQSRIIAVPATYSLRLGKIVHECNLLFRYPDHDLGELINRHQLICAEVERHPVVGTHDAMDALHAIVDIHERAGLLSISPDLYLVGISSVRDLAAHRRRRLLAAAIVGAQRAVHIVETYDTRRQTIILRVVLAELLRIELLEAVTFFRLR